MPLYEYRCGDCGHHFEVLQRLGEGASGLACPQCSRSNLGKQFSTFAAGSGNSSESDFAAACDAPRCGCGPFGCGSEN
jgi:putative FmdB family regulatory protein